MLRCLYYFIITENIKALIDELHEHLAIQDIKLNYIIRLLEQQSSDEN